MLPPGVGSLYPSSASFQSLLANISAAQRPTINTKPLGSNDYMMTNVSSSSPPISPVPVSSSSSSSVTISSSGSGGNGIGIGVINNDGGNSDRTTPPEDRRSSSIAALRLKAREHELRLERLRQNDHGDIIS